MLTPLVGAGFYLIKQVRYGIWRKQECNWREPSSGKDVQFHFHHSPQTYLQRSWSIGYLTIREYHSRPSTNTRLSSTVQSGTGKRTEKSLDWRRIVWITWVKSCIYGTRWHGTCITLDEDKVQRMITVQWTHLRKYHWESIATITELKTLELIPTLKKPSSASVWI